MVSPGFRKLSWVRQAEYHQTVTITFFGGASLALGSALEFLRGPTTELAITGCHIKSTFHHTSQSDREMVPCCCIESEKMTLQDGGFYFFFNFWSACEEPTYQAFSPFQFTSNAELFGNLLCSCKRISFDDGSQSVVVSLQWPATALLIFKALISCKTSGTTTALYIH